MPLWLEIILEIIKITVPALIVYFTAYNLLKTYLEKEQQRRSLKYQQANKQVTIPMRLQAYERLSLLCERIAVPNLLLRLKSSASTAQELKMAMLLTIQQEFEYNITQQVYVSEQLWSIIQIARDNTVTFIEEVSKQVNPGDDAKVLARAFLEQLQKHPELSLEKALSAIRKEASLIL